MRLDELLYCERTGLKKTVDLEIDSPHHNFYANDICVSNSHSVSYAYLAVQTLFLKHYYPTEFYTSLLNHPKSGADKEEKVRWLSLAISSAISKGIKVLPPSRRSGWNWSMTGDKEITMGFSAISGFGESAYIELQQVMKTNNQNLETINPYEFFELSFSAFDKSVFKACVHAGIFDDWSDSRLFLLHLREKKRKKKDPAQTALAFFDMDGEPMDTMTIENNTFLKTTSDERKADFLEVCNFDLAKIEYITKVRDEINNNAKFHVDNIMNYEEPGWYFFIVSKIEDMISKNGNPYINIKMGDGINTINHRVFGKDSERLKKSLQINGVYSTEFEKNKSGYLNMKRGATMMELKFDENVKLIKRGEKSQNKLQPEQTQR